MASKELKQRFDSLVACDERTDKYYNAIFHECLETVTREMATCDKEFATLYQRIHYGGSYWDKLRVGNTRHEFDLSLLFNIPCKMALGSEDKNFMKLDVMETAKDMPMYICDVEENGGKAFVSPKKMFDIIQRAADRAVTKLDSKICLKDGRQVSVARSVGAAYTLHLQTQNRSDDRIDVDLVPAVELPLTSLPGKIRNRVAKVQNLVAPGESKTSTYLAVALPKLDQKKFQIDFPLVAREVLKGRPSTRMAVRLLKQERDAKGGPMTKLWSHAIKTAVMHQVTKNPDPRHWHEALLPDRLNDVKTALQKNLNSNKMDDLFFPGVNMMARIKEPEVRSGVSKYLAKESNRTGPAERNTPCPVAKCNKMMKGDDAARQHAEDKHGYAYDKHGYAYARKISETRSVQCPIAKDKMFKSEADAVKHVESGACKKCPGREKARNAIFDFLKTKPFAQNFMHNQLDYNGAYSGYDDPKFMISEYPYKCNQCTRKFKDVSSLMQHQAARSRCKFAGVNLSLH